MITKTFKTKAGAFGAFIGGLKTMKTIIHSNGSKWAGEEPDSIEKLIEVLKNHDLDLRRFATNGFVSFGESNGYRNQQYEYHNVKIMGNFLDISHVFNIEGIYKNLRPLIDAIEENIANQCDRIKSRS